MKEAEKNISRLLYMGEYPREKEFEKVDLLHENLENALGIYTADWKASPEEVLNSINEQLGKFGLQVVVYETYGDFYAWHIEHK